LSVFRDECQPYLSCTPSLKQVTYVTLLESPRYFVRGTYNLKTMHAPDELISVNRKRCDSVDKKGFALNSELLPLFMR